jgi:hypothetical protein
VRIIACIEDTVVIKAILADLAESAPGARTAAATRPGAACVGLKRFTQRHLFKRIFV